MSEHASALPALPGPTLAGLLDRVAALRSLDAAALATALDAPLDVRELSPWVRYDPERYVRALVARGPGYELRLLCWTPGQSSALHGHGASACAFRVLEGTARELRLGQPDRLLHPGDIAEAGATEVHQVGPEGDRPLLTLHIYAPALPVDQPSTPEGRRVVIVGSGFCGTALAVHLLKTGAPDLRITLVERGPDVGRGVAYGTTDPAHVLNVPAAKMSLDPDDPDAFLRFARERGVSARPTDLLPRALYGDYVNATLARAITQHPGRVRVARGEAVDVEPGGVRLAHGALLPADQVVLATGHLLPSVPAGLPASVRQDPRFLRDAWEPGGLGRIQPDERVLILGTGLTALDVLLTLRRQAHRGPVVATSRNGRWPLPHLPDVAWTSPGVVLDVDRAPRTADGLNTWLRGEIRAAAARQIPWQAVIDAFRPHLPRVWAELPQAERARFLAVYKPVWEVHRHRAPVASLVALRSWQDQGGLSVVVGEIVGAEIRPGGLQVWLSGPAGETALEVDRIVTCTGADTAVSRAQNPLLQALLARGEIQQDALGLGLEVDPDGRAIGADGLARDRLWVLGAARRSRLWETTAVPELSRQAAALAREGIGAARVGVG